MSDTSKPKPRGRVAPTTGLRTPTHEEINRLAHQIWEERGRPSGCEEEHWHEAERRLMNGVAEAADSASGMSSENPGATAASNETYRSSASNPPASAAGNTATMPASSSGRSPGGGRRSQS